MLVGTPSLASVKQDRKYNKLVDLNLGVLMDNLVLPNMGT